MDVHQMEKATTKQALIGSLIFIYKNHMEKYKKSRKVYLKLLAALILGALFGALLITGIDYLLSQQ